MLQDEIVQHQRSIDEFAVSARQQLREAAEASAAAGGDSVGPEALPPPTEERLEQLQAKSDLTRSRADERQCYLEDLLSKVR